MTSLRASVVHLGCSQVSSCDKSQLRKPNPMVCVCTCECGVCVSIYMYLYNVLNFNKIHTIITVWYLKKKKTKQKRLVWTAVWNSTFSREAIQEKLFQLRQEERKKKSFFHLLRWWHRLWQPALASGFRNMH